jgi:SAM-dependent methyltransferase
MSGARVITRVARRTLRRPQIATVPIDRLVFGAPTPVTMEQLARRTGNVAMPSRRVSRWPDLLPVTESLGLDPASSRSERVVATRVRRSECLAVIAGHELVAAAFAAGDVEIEAMIIPGLTSTPLQSLLLDMGWLDGQVALYQPIDTPDVAGWPLVRACTDRLQLMLELLDGMGPAGAGTYLDVASSYGWFVAEMQERGYDAWGIERDDEARLLGSSVYGLDPSHVLIGDCVDLLAELPQFDVVSCLSLLHHFVWGPETAKPEDVIEALSRVTRRVLFVDTGEAHEKWLRKPLAGWTPEFIQQWLTRYGDFDRVVPLGVDHDGTGRFAGNYGRTLFACIRGQALPLA